MSFETNLKKYYKDVENQLDSQVKFINSYDDLFPISGINNITKEIQEKITAFEQKIENEIDFKNIYKLDKEAKNKSISCYRKFVKKLENIHNEINIEKSRLENELSKAETEIKKEAIQNEIYNLEKNKITRIKNKIAEISPEDVGLNISIEKLKDFYQECCDIKTDSETLDSILNDDEYIDFYKVLCNSDKSVNNIFKEFNIDKIEVEDGTTVSFPVKNDFKDYESRNITSTKNSDGSYNIKINLKKDGIVPAEYSPDFSKIKNINSISKLTDEFSYYKILQLYILFLEMRLQLYSKINNNINDYNDSISRFNEGLNSFKESLELIDDDLKASYDEEEHEVVRYSEVKIKDIVDEENPKFENAEQNNTENLSSFEEYLKDALNYIYNTDISMSSKANIKDVDSIKENYISAISLVSNLDEIEFKLKILNTFVYDGEYIINKDKFIEVCFEKYIKKNKIDEPFSSSNNRRTYILNSIQEDIFVKDVHFLYLETLGSEYNMYKTDYQEWSKKYFKV